MCFTAKSCLTAWWVLAFMSLFLWYRNLTYDRVLAGFIFTMGLIQLIEYGIHTGANPLQAGKIIFMILWLQCLIMAIGTFFFIKGALESHQHLEVTPTQRIIQTISRWNLIFFSLVFIGALLWIFNSPTDANLMSPEGSTNRGSVAIPNFNFMTSWYWLYILGVFIPLVLIFGFYMWADFQIALLILYGIFSIAYILTNYPLGSFNSLWSYLSAGFAFIAWLLGSIPQTPQNILL